MQQLEDGAAIDDLRGSWDRLIVIRRDLDRTVLALAERMDEIRNTVAEPEPAEPPVPPPPDEIEDAIE